MPKRTTERGLGWEHQKARARLLEAHIDGTPCPYCDQPMYRHEQLDADHSIPRAQGGTVADRLSHASCNRKAGSALAHGPVCPHHRGCGSVHSRAW